MKTVKSLLAGFFAIHALTGSMVAQAEALSAGERTTNTANTIACFEEANTTSLARIFDEVKSTPLQDLNFQINLAIEDALLASMENINECVIAQTGFSIGSDEYKEHYDNDILEAEIEIASDRNLSQFIDSLQSLLPPQ